MTKKTSVMLARGWPGEFRRTVRDSEGNALNDEAGNPRILSFSPGQPVELAADELEAVRDDVGKSLHIAKLDEGKPVAKPDSDATAKFVEETRKLREQEASESGKRPKRTTEPAKTSSTAQSAPSHKDLEHKAK